MSLLSQFGVAASLIAFSGSIGSVVTRHTATLLGESESLIGSILGSSVVGFAGGLLAKKIVQLTYFLMNEPKLPPNLEKPVHLLTSMKVKQFVHPKMKASAYIVTSSVSKLKFVIDKELITIVATSLGVALGVGLGYNARLTAESSISAGRIFGLSACSVIAGKVGQFGPLKRALAHQQELLFVGNYCLMGACFLNMCKSSYSR